MNLSQLIMLISLAALWGSSFMFMRIAAPEIGPVSLIALRAAIGFITLLPFLIFYKGWADIRQYWREIFVVGITNTAIPFVLLAFATLTLSAGLTSILNATAPIFAALVAFIWLNERLTKNKTIGLIVGFIGVVTLFVSKGNLHLDATSIALFAGLIAALNYGFSACYTKKKLTGTPPLAIATGSQLFAFMVFIPFLPFAWPEQSVSNIAWYSTIVLGSACTALAYILYFKLIASLGPEKAISVTYLIPVFGVMWGTLFLKEQISWTMMIGGGLILLGVGLTTGLFRRKSKHLQTG